MTRTTILGFLAAGFTLSYFLSKKSEADDGGSIAGIDIKINPTKLVDGALAVSSINPSTKDGIRQIAHNAIRKYYEN